MLISLAANTRECTLKQNNISPNYFYVPSEGRPCSSHKEKVANHIVIGKHIKFPLLSVLDWPTFF